jgi:hypothetical protein
VVDSTVPFTFNPRKLQFFDAQTGANLGSEEEEVNHG